MKAGFTTLAKLLAVCLFLGLLSGYVWHRYDEGKKEEARRQAAAALKNEKADKAKQAKANQESDEFIMSSSKSARMVMPGSKSMPMEFGSEDFAYQWQDYPVEPADLDETRGEEDQEIDPIMIPSSKSGRVRLEDVPQLNELFEEDSQKQQK